MARIVCYPNLSLASSLVMAGLTSTWILVMRPSAKPVGLPDFGCSASQLKKLHFFAKPEGFKYFNIENRIANKCVSGNQVNPEEGSCPDSLNSSCLSKKAAWGQVDQKQRATECISERKPREEPSSGSPRVPATVQYT